MAQNGTPFLIPFGDFGMVAHPNRWRSQPGELVLAENHVVENDLLQKDPSSAYYFKLPGGEPPESFQLKATFGAADTSIVLVTWFEGKQTAPGVVAWRAGAIGASGTIQSTVLFADVAVGQLVVVTFTREAGTGGLVAITDPAGNVYTRAALYDNTGVNGLLAEIWVSLITQPLATGQKVSLQLAAGTKDVNASAIAYAGVGWKPVALGTMKDLSSGTTIDAMASVPMKPHRYPLLGIGVIATASAASSITTAAPWTVVDFANAGNHREWHLAQSYFSNGAVVAQIEFASNAPAKVAPAGTATVTKGSRVVQGSTTGTLANFQSVPFMAGDAIIVGGETQIVESVQSNTQLTTMEPWEHSQAGATYARRAGPRLISAITHHYDPTKALQLVIYKEVPGDGQRGRKGELTGIPLYGPTNGFARAARFVVGGKEIATEPRKLFFFNGVDPVQVLKGDADTMVPLTTPPDDWATTLDPSKQPINGIIHQDALFAFGNWNDPHRVYVSTTGDHTVFKTSDAFQMKISSNIGERLYGCAQYQGVLFFWKYPAGIFYLDDTIADRLQWGYRIRSQALGCAPSPHAVLAIDDDVIFCDASGHFHLLSAVNTLGGTADSDLTRMLGLQRWTQAQLSMASLEHLVSVYDPQTKTAWFGVRSLAAADAGYADNDLLIRFDFARRREGGPVRVTTSRTWTPNSLCLKRHNFRGRPCVVFGEVADSQMTYPDQYGSRTDFDYVAGAEVTRGIPTIATLPEHDCDEANARLRHVRKAFRSLEVVVQDATVTPQTLFIDLYVDTQLRQTMTVRLGASRRILDTISVGEGYTLTANCRTDGSVAADAPLIGLIVYFQPTGTDMSRKS